MLNVTPPQELCEYIEEEMLTNRAGGHFKQLSFHGYLLLKTEVAEACDQIKIIAEKFTKRRSVT